jgi:hypothetical protein
MSSSFPRKLPPPMGDIRPNSALQFVFLNVITTLKSARQEAVPVVNREKKQTDRLSGSAQAKVPAGYEISSAAARARRPIPDAIEAVRFIRPRSDYFPEKIVQASLAQTVSLAALKEFQSGMRGNAFTLFPCESSARSHKSGGFYNSVSRGNPSAHEPGNRARPARSTTFGERPSAYRMFRGAEAR